LIASGDPLGPLSGSPLDDARTVVDDLHLREVTVSSEQVYRGHFLDVRRDVVRLPDGHTAPREYIVHPGAVVIVPLQADGRLIVERQYRYPMQRTMLEFPAGKLDRHEPTFACAQRELSEETGYTAREWARAGLMHNAIAYATEGIEIWFARQLTPGPCRLDAGEFLDVEVMSLDELEDATRTGALTDAKSLVALLWLRRWRDGVWPLVWIGTDGAVLPHQDGEA
jgi:ADP-ribose pyrophosphatase